MAENSSIEWTDHTFNPWEGCQKVGPGCYNCYAETRNARYAAPKGEPRVAINWGAGAPRRRTSVSNWRKPLHWQANAPAFLAMHGRRQRVFCASLADVFDNAVDPAWRADLFDVIRATPDLDWLLLTKRIGNAEAMAQAAGGLPANVWLGATIVNQAEADRDVPKLLGVYGPRFRFLSMEPLLGPVDLTSIRAPRYPDEPADSLDIDWRFDALTTGDHYWFDGEHGQPGDCGDGPYRNARIDWVIAGGESGAGARPSHPDWYRALRNQCAGANLGGDDAPVPFLFKQWGEWREWDDGSGNPEAEEVENDSEYADMVYASAIGPAFISQDGRVFARADLPEELPCRLVERVGKKGAGRLLDGITHDGVPA